MASCMSCGSGVPSGQDVCSMCYGDMDYGDDGYYQDWLEREREDERNWESQMELLERIEEIKVLC